MKKIFISYFIAMTFICQHVIAAQDYQSCTVEAIKKCRKEHTAKEYPVQTTQTQNSVVNITLNNGKSFLYDFSKQPILYVKNNFLYKDSKYTNKLLNLGSAYEEYNIDESREYANGRYILGTYECCGTPPAALFIGQYNNPNYKPMPAGYVGGNQPTINVYLEKAAPAMAAPTMAAPTMAAPARRRESLLELQQNYSSMAAPTMATGGRRTLSENQSYKVTGIRHTKSK